MPIQQILGPLFGGIVKLLQKNGKILAVAVAGAGAGVAATSIHKEREFKKRIKQIEKDNAIKFESEVKKEMEEIRKQYQDNEDELRRKVNQYLRGKGYDVSF